MSLRSCSVKQWRWKCGQVWPGDLQFPPRVVALGEWSFLCIVSNLGAKCTFCISYGCQKFTMSLSFSDCPGILKWICIYEFRDAMSLFPSTWSLGVPSWLFKFVAYPCFSLASSANAEGLPPSQDVEKGMLYTIKSSELGIGKSEFKFCLQLSWGKSFNFSQSQGFHL